MQPDLSHAGAASDAFICVLIGVCVSAAILWTLLKTGLAWRLATDIPNDRSLHTRPTPRVGGWGVLPALALAIFLYAPDFRLIALGALLLGVISQIDDRRGLPARIRFGAHVVVVAAGIALSVVGIAWWMAVLAAFALVWVVNLYNFMDGSDGLAGGMTVFGFGFYAVAAAVLQPTLSVPAAAVTGAGFGFLIFNRHPAKIFLGDAGSIPLGFLAGVLGFWGWQHGVWPIWFPALVFAPFVADATATLARRLARGEKVWLAHREHYYQRLVRLTESHVRVAMAYYLLMLGSGCVALLALRVLPTVQWTLFGAWYVVLAVVGWEIDRRWRQFILTQGNDNDAN
ncbi:MraY family glycosyltransferase [Caballeronia sp. 15715]|uniref:MraY family glycosyltransferase n=1 Tax=Caballeronia sp. 15715 TaxID=3391030 RepID=UPI0039E3EFAB